MVHHFPAILRAPALRFATKMPLFNDGKIAELIVPGYRVDAATDAAIRYIDNHKNRPFFLFLSFLEPHFQNHRDDYPTPDGYEEQFRSSISMMCRPIHTNSQISSDSSLTDRWRIVSKNA